MTNDEATEMLKALSAHFREPVLPVSRYCAALRTWRDAIETAHGESTDKHRPFGDIVPALQSVELAITKSNLLWRLIYAGQPLRTKKCPEHQGHWSGLAGPWNDCEHGCDLTGWIPDDFVPPQPGEACRHKWRWREVATGRVVCASCKETVNDCAGKV